MSQLEAIVLGSEPLVRALDALEALSLPDAYVAAGCVVQTIWNARYGLPAAYGIDDMDIVYFDAQDVSAQGEQAWEERFQRALPDLPWRLDVKNEARVHLWYEAKFGYAIAPYDSCEAAIRSFPTTATAIGIRRRQDGLVVYAPYGTEDLCAGIVRPNKMQVTEAIYMAKARKWQAKWPGLTVMPWDE